MFIVVAVDDAVDDVDVAVDGCCCSSLLLLLLLMAVHCCCCFGSELINFLACCLFIVVAVDVAVVDVCGDGGGRGGE